MDRATQVFQLWNWDCGIATLATLAATTHGKALAVCGKSHLTGNRDRTKRRGEKCVTAREMAAALGELTDSRWRVEQIGSKLASVDLPDPCAALLAGTDPNDGKPWEHWVAFGNGKVWCSERGCVHPCVYADATVKKIVRRAD